MTELSRTSAESASRGPEIFFEDIHTRWGSDRRERSGPTEHARAEALSGLTLRLPAGQITVLLGDHGSGKTLLALHLLGEQPPDRGRVLVGDHSVWELPEDRRRELHDQIGLLRGGTAIRESEMTPDWSVRQNLTAQLGHSDAHRSIEDAVQACLDAFDLATVADSTPERLNPEARRRLALAVALADDPDLVVIDDPGQALDYHHLDDMIESIRGWQARTRATMLITVHSLRVARELADQVVILRGGQVLAQGPPGEVLDGVTDDESYEQHFGASLGGTAESDPERGRSDLRRNNRGWRRLQLALGIVFLLLVITLVGVLLSGVLDNPLLPGGDNS